MERETFTIYGHWVFDDKLTQGQATQLVVEDFAIKCANILNTFDYSCIKWVRLSLGIYELFFKNFGISDWWNRGYEVCGKCNSEEDRNRYKMFSIIRTYLSDKMPYLSDKEIWNIIGAGEIPFISVYERLDDDGKYHYVYTISR